MKGKLFTLATMLVAFAFMLCGIAEAGIITNKLPLQCYVGNRIYTFNSAGGKQVGYIDANVDLIQVLEMRGDGWVRGTYPGSGGRRVERWFKASDLFVDSGYSNRDANVQGAQRVFRTQNSNDTIGSVSNNESVTVVADNGSRAQIVYRLDNGTGYKMGWIPSSVVSSRVVPPIPNPNPTPATIKDGYYRIQPMHDLGRSVDALGPQIGKGNNVHMWTTVDASQQKFKLQNRGNGYFSLQSMYGSQLFVTADGRGNGANLYTAVWNGSDSQLFKAVAAGNNSYHIFAKVGVNLNFDCAGGGKSDGNNVQLWTTESSPWHQWRLTPVTLDPPTPTPTPSGKIVTPMKNWYCTWRSHSHWSWSDYTYNSSHPERSWHLGLDVYGNNGYVYAMADGKVAKCSNSNSGGGANGRFVIIEHNLGGQHFYSFYAHLASVQVSDGQSITAGQQIGVAGGSGSGSDSLYKTHLHFAIVDTLWTSGKYWGYATKFSGDKIFYDNVTYYNPKYVIENGRLP